MNRTMRRYGPTLADGLLGNVCGLGALLCLITLIMALVLGPDRGWVFGGLTVALAAAAFGALLTASVGVRQNSALIDIGAVFAVASGISWVIWWLGQPPRWPAVFGGLLIILGVLLLWQFGATLRVRYHPRFLTARQLATTIQVVDAVIEGDGREELSSPQVAVNVDHLLARMNSPTTKDLRFLMIVIEYAVPLVTVLRPVPFSLLGSHTRRRAIERVIGRKGLFRTVARSVKLLSMMGYYGDAATAADTGYVPFDQRALDDEQKKQAPLVHPEPA